jgi:hypothetical protein
VLGCLEQPGTPEIAKHLMGVWGKKRSERAVSPVRAQSASTADATVCDAFTPKVCTYQDHALLQLFVEKLLPSRMDTKVEILSQVLRTQCQDMVDMFSQQRRPTAFMVGLCLEQGVSFELLHQELYHAVIDDIRAHPYPEEHPRRRDNRIWCLNFYFRPILRRLRKHTSPQVAALARTWVWEVDEHEAASE